MEQLMMTVPNFAPRGVGFRFTEAQVFITITAATPTEILDGNHEADTLSALPKEIQ